MKVFTINKKREKIKKGIIRFNSKFILGICCGMFVGILTGCVSNEGNINNSLVENEVGLVKSLTPTGFAGSSFNKIEMYSDGSVYWIQYDGAGEADENIVKNLKISNNAEDIEMLHEDEGIFVKGDRVGDVETGWLKFNNASPIAKEIDMGKEVNVDLDGDGEDEQVYYGLDDFRINNVSYKDKIQYKVYENNPVTSHFIIADIDESDNQKEVVLKVEGPSDDPESYFYTYKGNELFELGSIPSEAKVLDFDGKGSIEGILRLSVLHTWWAPAKWGFDKYGKIEQKNQDIYYPKQIGNEPIMLLEELPVYKEIGDNKTTTIKPQEVNITKTDNKNYCYIEAKDGTSGWFKIENFYKVVDLDSKPATDVFTNLVMAD